jgi:hypothetical protein
MSKFKAIWAVALLLLFVLPLSAGVTIFQASDPGSTSGVGANSGAAALSFTNAIDPAANRLITFENDPTGIGTFFNLAGSGVGGSVSVQCINCATSSRLGELATGIQRNLTTANQPNLVGYNTTQSGGNLFRFAPLSVSTLTDFVVRFDFTNAIQAFGSFITGMQQGFAGSLFLQYTDGASQSFAFTGNPTALGGIQFLGFTSTSQTALVSRVEFRFSGITLGGDNIRDIMAFDDIRLGMLTSTGGSGGGTVGPTGGGGFDTGTPEPSTYLLFAGGLAALAVLRRKRRKAA